MTNEVTEKRLPTAADLDAMRTIIKNTDSEQMQTTLILKYIEDNDIKRGSIVIKTVDKVRELSLARPNPKDPFDQIPDESEILKASGPLMSEEAVAFLNELTGKVEYSLETCPGGSIIVERVGNTIEEVVRPVIMDLVAPLPEGPNDKVFHIDTASFEVTRTHVYSSPEDTSPITGYRVKLKGDWK